MQIIPAIIPQSFHDLETHVSEVKGFASNVQIDIIDGKYAPTKSWPYKIKEDPDFKKVTDGEKGLPAWQDVQFEIDMMIENPEDSWRDWVSAGASRIIIHLESTKNIGKIIADFKEENVSPDSFLYSQIGLAILPETDLEQLYPYLEDVDFIQFMGSQKIGRHGEEFDERILEKIKKLKIHRPDTVVGVDIGMNEKTIPLVGKAGAERVAVGSALFEDGDIKDQYEHLSRL